MTSKLERLALKGTRKNGVSLSSWLRHSIRALKNGEDIKVPCAGCTACCRSPLMNVILVPDEYDRFEKVPFGNDYALPRKEDGSCCKFIDGKCSIYETRPKVCRQFDCRVHLIGLIGEKDEIMEEAVSEWEDFEYKTAEDQESSVALRLAMLDFLDKPMSVYDKILRVMVVYRNYLARARKIILRSKTK